MATSQATVIARGVYGAREEYDEDGNPRLLVVSAIATSPAEIARAHRAHREQQASAWCENPVCVSCGATIREARAAAVVALDDGDRVACRGTCFVEAIRRRIDERTREQR